MSSMETGIAHLLEAAVKLNCSLEVTARGLLLYHHIMVQIAEIYEDECMIAAVSLNISGRLCEQVINIDMLICVFYSIVNETTEVMSSEDMAYILLKKTVIEVDFLTQKLLEFNLRHRLAHQYLLPFLVMILERNKNIADYRTELSSTCLRFISDFYTQRICLKYQPELIAIACIDLSLYVHGFINDVAMVPPWYMGFVCDITPEKVKEIKKKIMSFLENPLVIYPPLSALQISSDVDLIK